MPRFRVLRGKHREGGKTYAPGEVVDSKTDLVAKLGAGKFERLDDAGRARRARALPPPPPPDEDLEDPPVPEIQSVFPGGQVSTGKQQALASPYGPPSGPLPADQDPLNRRRRAAEEQPEPQTQPEGELESMTVTQLKDYAQGEGIDLKGARLKDEIVQAIKDHEQQQQEAPPEGEPEE